MMTKTKEPLILQRADPHILLADDGFYYFTASVPEYDRIELRRARTIPQLRSAEPRVIWRHHASGPMSKYIWAPECHQVDGAWMIYFAADGAEPDDKGVFNHRIYALRNENADPFTGAFAECGPIDTGWQSFALDSTTFALNGTRYFVWAQRDYAIPGNSNLYIARMESATRLNLPAVMLSRPEYDWECQGFLVNEGPSVLVHDGRVFLTYSGSATDERYAMGLLEASADADLLNPVSWRKSETPILATDPELGIYGPGHNSFTKDENGADLMVFHARPYPGFVGTPLSDPNRNAFVWPVVYGADGRPGI